MLNFILDAASRKYSKNMVPSHLFYPYSNWRISYHSERRKYDKSGTVIHRCCGYDLVGDIASHPNESGSQGVRNNQLRQQEYHHHGMDCRRICVDLHRSLRGNCDDQRPPKPRLNSCLSIIGIRIDRVGSDILVYRLQGKFPSFQTLPFHFYSFRCSHFHWMDCVNNKDAS